MEKCEDWKLKISRQDLKEILTERYPCFVLMTCGNASAEGKIEVEMMYDGDASLAAYMIESAQMFIEDES
ncbi:MAG: hypothetical protein RLZZ453_413 [Chlamydiota bacterium]|jgi:hypothetical protein